MRDLTVSELLRDLGAKQPTPGGGAVSALNGAIAAAQLKMICEYTKDDKVNQRKDSLAQKVETFLDLADEDMRVFTTVSEAYRTGNQDQINSSLISAIDPSINVVDICDELLEFCENNIRAFNPKLEADLVVVLANIKAAIRSAKAMIATNQKSLGEHALKNASTYIVKCDELLGRIDNLYMEIGA